MNELKSLRNLKKMQINNLTVYTCITGNYDDLKTPLGRDPNVRYICFTNNPNLKSDFWEIEMISNPLKLDDIRLARYVKTNPHEFVHTPYSIWIDGSMQLVGSINGIMNHFVQKELDLLTVKHPFCGDVYEELMSCVFFQKGEPEIMARQVYDYRAEGLPAKTGQVETGLLIRRNDAKLNAFGKLWFDEIKNKSRRDQLSFMYIFWKLKNPFKLGTITVQDREKFLKLYQHNK